MKTTRDILKQHKRLSVDDVRARAKALVDDHWCRFINEWHEIEHDVSELPPEPGM